MEIHPKCFASLSGGDECDFKDSSSYEINPGETGDDLIARLGLPKQEIKLFSSTTGRPVLTPR